MLTPYFLTMHECHKDINTFEQDLNFRHSIKLDDVRFQRKEWSLHEVCLVYLTPGKPKVYWRLVQTQKH